MSRWENLIGQKIEIEPSFILDQGELFRITLPYSKNDIGSYLMNAGTPNEILVNKKLSIKMAANTSIEQMVSILPQVITEAYNILQLADADEGNDFRYIYNNSIKPARACLIAKTYEECLKKIGPWELWIALNHSVLTSETLKRENLLDTVPALAGVESIRLDHAARSQTRPPPILKVFTAKNISLSFRPTTTEKKRRPPPLE